MSSRATLDRDSFQRLLSSAFAVQESRMSRHSLSAIVEIQRLVLAGDLDLDVAVRLIASHAQNVANATGVAIAFLQDRKLVYQAGVGSASSYIGRQLTATLGISGDSSTSREILRVENAHTDARIEAAICRQFGARALLMIPICQNHAVTGVLEILFSEAHAFQEGEIRTYRLMAGLVGEAMSRADQMQRVAATERAVAPLAPQHVSSQSQILPKVSSIRRPSITANRDAIYHFYRALLTVARRLPALCRVPKLRALWQTPQVGTAQRKIIERLDRVPLPVFRWGLGVAAGIALVTVGWSSFSGRHTPSALQTSSAVNRQTSVSEKSVGALPSSHLQTASGGAHAKKHSKSAFRRMQVGENEVDYVADDVTIRHFKRRPASQPLRAYNQVEFGTDVTVRHFVPDRGR